MERPHQLVGLGREDRTGLDLFTCRNVLALPQAGEGEQAAITRSEASTTGTGKRMASGGPGAR
jgi:hypothetical protein